MQVEIPIDLIDPSPYQIRSAYSKLKIDALTSSIKKYGLMQIPIARRRGSRYQLAFGHHRLEAFKILKTECGWLNMPLQIEELDDIRMFEYFIIENMQRKDLSIIDKAIVLRRYINEFNATSDQASSLFGIKASTVRGMIRLLDLPEPEQEKMQNGKLTQTEARKMLSRRSGHPTCYHSYTKIDQTSNFKIKLIVLLFGKYEPNITDEILYSEVKRIRDIANNIEHQKPPLDSRRLVATIKGPT